MSKKRNELPTMTGIETVKPSNELDANAEFAQTPTADIRPSCVFVTIQLPVQSEPPSRSFQDEATRVDLRKINRERMAKLRALRRGLVTTDATFLDGTPLRTNSDVVYYILDQITIPK